MYLAYGSNLHPTRLRERVPSASVVGVVPIAGHRLEFSKVGTDASGKCTMLASGCRDDIVYGVLYDMDAGHKSRLDSAEGKGAGYNEHKMSCELGEACYTPFTYLAQAGYIDASLRPYGWYRDMVLEGARYHMLPASYIQMLERISAVPDPDNGRSAENELRLQAMRKDARICSYESTFCAG
jgi:gamma-glutamylcyclotransferase